MIAPGFESHQCLAGMWKRWLSCHAGCQEVGRCHTRGESQGMCNVTSTPPLSSNKAEPTLALNPEETSPEVQNRGISGPTKRTHVLQNFFKKKEINWLCSDRYQKHKFPQSSSLESHKLYKLIIVDFY